MSGVALDASVLIAFLNPGDAHHPRAAAALTEPNIGKLWIGTLTLAEVLVAPTRLQIVPQVIARVRKLGIEDAEPGPDDAARLAALRVRTGLRLPDCAVLLTAHRASARALWTFDARLAACAQEEGFDVLD
ncbi:MAG: type II toxin-antitoxin system VapC family toxin [Nocardioides sp.]|uniref:type II toxin-antitoxin system VapC family toxin n=1 Tax=Nocardioides sp. TaxID=35761 RepID=UPI0039E60AC7